MTIYAGPHSEMLPRRLVSEKPDSRGDDSLLGIMTTTTTSRLVRPLVGIGRVHHPGRDRAWTVSVSNSELGPPKSNRRSSSSSSWQSTRHSNGRIVVVVVVGVPISPRFDPSFRPCESVVSAMRIRRRVYAAVRLRRFHSNSCHSSSAVDGASVSSICVSGGGTK